MLWGNYAQQVGKHIDETKHLVIRCAHPSPLSANRGGWFGTKPFSRANDFLKKTGSEPINWT
jgi:uracil-DNA glycosylase